MDFSDILLTVDFDRTLTARNSSIPQRNLEAIAYFMEHGGTFTVNTGRSLPMTASFRDKVPTNAPWLLYNGSAAFDPRTEEFLFAHKIPLDPVPVLKEVMETFPELPVEIQSVDAHILFRDDPAWVAFTAGNGCAWKRMDVGEAFGPFLKMSIYGKLSKTSVAHLFDATAAEAAQMDQVEDWMRDRYGDAIQVIRVAKRIIDCHAPGVSKGNAARLLQQKLGKKTLVCVGDEQNDMTMLDMADYGFVPGDSPLAGRYETVCPCDDGAVADVIYEKIPKILAKNP